MKESAAWNALRPHLTRVGLRWRRIEDALAKGTPDVLIGRADDRTRWVWAELKCTEKMPAKGLNGMRGFTAEQRLALRQLGGILLVYRPLARAWWAYDVATYKIGTHADIARWLRDEVLR